jgi:hypothetical protein
MTSTGTISPVGAPGEVPERATRRQEETEAGFRARLSIGGVIGRSGEAAGSAAHLAVRLQRKGRLANATSRAA